LSTPSHHRRIKCFEQSSEKDLPSFIKKKRERWNVTSVQASFHHFSKAEATRGEFTQPGEHFLSPGKFAGTAKLPYPSALLLAAAGDHKSPCEKGLELEPGAVEFTKLWQQVNPLKTNVFLHFVTDNKAKHFSFCRNHKTLHDV